MPKNRDTPALFELVRSTGIKRSSTTSRENPLIPEKTTVTPQKQAKPTPKAPLSKPTAAAVDEPASLNRTVRLPLGYLFVAAMAMIVLLVIAYSVGFARGKNNSPAQKTGFVTIPDTSQGNNSTSANKADTGSIKSDQSMDHKAETPVSTDESRINNNHTAGVPTLDRTQDTRQRGLNYIIVERFSTDEANRVADYLSGQGIDAMVLPTNNRHLRQVVVRQGFAGWSSNREGLALLSRIKQLGREWKARHGGTKNFDQAYGNKYGG